MANSVYLVPEELIPSANGDMAISPYSYPRLTIVRALQQCYTVTCILLAAYRSTWFLNVFMGFVIPFGFIFFLKSAGGAITQSRAVFLVGGNMATSIALGPTSFLITKLGWAKQTQEFDYWISLPLPKLTLIFSTIIVALLFALPGLVGIYIFGHLLFNLPFTNALILIPLIPLGVLPLAGLGTLLGTYAPNGQAANILSSMMLIFIGFLSPMMIPLNALPAPLRVVSWFVPTTYVADAFREVLSGRLTTQFSTDIVLLVVFSIAFLSLAYVSMDWRAK